MHGKNTKKRQHPVIEGLGDNVVLVAHRGASKFEQGNTIKAFEKAIELKSRIIEFDVRRTRDRVLVVHHDADIHGVKIRDMGYSEILNKFPGENVATLEEVINTIGKHAILDIEIKEADITEEAIRLIDSRYDKSEYVITSLLDQVLIDAKRLSPGACTGLILGSPVLSRTPIGHAKDMVPWKRVKHTEADFLVVNHYLADIGVLRGACRRDIPMIVWTIKTARQRKKYLQSRGVIGIVVDDPTQ